MSSSQKSVLQVALPYVGAAALLIASGSQIYYFMQKRKRQATNSLQEKFPHLADRNIELTATELKLLQAVISPESITTTLSDIGGLEEVKRGVKESVILPFQRPDLFQHRAQFSSTTNGILLFGPPGTGKTLIARAIARECGAVFINVEAHLIKSQWYGDSEQNVNALFSLARKLQPTILFFDEIDSLLSTRRDGTSVSDVDNAIKSGVMTQWDGIDKSNDCKVIVIGATNRPSAIDAAVLRRLSRKFKVPLPDQRSRAQILEILLSDARENENQSNSTPRVSSHNVNIDLVASRTAGFSGSELKDLCTTAALRPVREYLELEEKYHAGTSSSAPPNAVRCMNTQDFLESLVSIVPTQNAKSLGSFI